MSSYKPLRLLAALTMLLAGSVKAAEVEMWNEVDISARLTDRLTVTAPVVVRDSFSLSNPQLDGGGPIFDFALNKSLSVTAGYLFVSVPNAGRGYNVNVPLAAVTFVHRLGRVRIADRNRAEYLSGFIYNPIRYRNKLTIDFPLGARGYWTPFLSDEAFYDFSQSAWSQNRFQVGVGRRFSPALRLDAYFLQRSNLLASAGNSHAIGVTLEISVGHRPKEEGAQHGKN